MISWRGVAKKRRAQALAGLTTKCSSSVAATQQSLRHGNHGNGQAGRVARAPGKSAAAGGRSLIRCYQRQHDPDFRSLARRAVEVERAAQPVGHDVMDDVQAKPDTSAVA